MALVIQHQLVSIGRSERREGVARGHERPPLGRGVWALGFKVFALSEVPHRPEPRHRPLWSSRSSAWTSVGTGASAGRSTSNQADPLQPGVRPMTLATVRLQSDDLSYDETRNIGNSRVESMRNGGERGRRWRARRTPLNYCFCYSLSLVGSQENPLACIIAFSNV